MKYINYHRATVDPKNPMLPTYYGTFEYVMDIGGHTRRLLYYVPDGAMASTAGVMLLPPSGMTADEFLESSNWKQLCETEECKEKFILCILEAEAGRWHTDEQYGDPSSDAAYVGTSFAEFSRRNLFCVHESKYYLVGYGDGAAAAQRAALWDPALYAGLVCVDSPAVDPAYRTQAEEALCLNLDGYEDPDARYGIRKKDVPLPVWMIASNAAKAAEMAEDLEHWRARCEAVRQVGRPAPDTIAYVRTAETAYPLDQDREAYRVWQSVIPDAANELGARVNRRIWKDFLSRVRRWMSEPGGSLRMTEDPIRDLKCEYHYEEIGGWMREWYVYAPKQVREAPEKAVPVVMISHGYTCSGEIYLGNTAWNRVADKYGFIVVAATAPFDKIQGKGENKAAKFDNTDLPAWNIFGKPECPDEIAFFRHMLEDVCANYAVDQTRVYATGHSWGNMMTHYLGMAMPDVFAAIAPCSGVLFDEHDETMLANPQIIKEPSCELPIWMFAGEMEPWLLPHLPAEQNSTARSIRIWNQRNGMEAPDAFDTGWNVHGRWNDLSYEKDGRPLVRYTWVEYLPHATMPSMAYRIWEEFFSRFVRVNGEIRYVLAE